MNTDQQIPKTLQDAIVYFSNPDVALEFVKNIRWPDGVVKCPRCGSVHVSFTAKRRVWTCEDCPKREQFSVKVGTIMEDSHLSLDKWLVAFWLMSSAKNGISSYEIHRALGITQKTAWFLEHRIRLALKDGTFEKMSGQVEADETYIGGRVRLMNAKHRRKPGRGTGGVGKAIVMGLLERHATGSRVKLKHVPNAKRPTVQGEIRQHVAAGSQIYTDALRSYNGLERDYIHRTIDHAECYAKGAVHTNGLENFWCLLKRCFKGTHVSVEPFHLFRYLDEEAFRFNNRTNVDGERFVKAVGGMTGKHMTYKQLIGATGGS
ncbi:MAG TPA: IS1595 family transposase [Verrucomicrobiae bacterium]|nr:IS1595 family transposase [Verrucomicrobiae bacterium]